MSSEHDILKCKGNCTIQFLPRNPLESRFRLVDVWRVSSKPAEMKRVKTKRIHKESLLCKRPPACCISWSKNDKLSNWHSLGFTPLHIAVVTRAPRFSLCALAKSGFANIKSKDGFTALHLAAILTPDYDTIQALINGGVHLNVMDNLQRTALDFAAFLNHRDAVDAILTSSHIYTEKMFKKDILSIPFEKVLAHCSLLLCRPYELREVEWPFSILHEGTLFDNQPRKMFAIAGQGNTALHFAVASPMRNICLRCLPDWKPRDHKHGYSTEDEEEAEAEHQRRLQAHSGDFVTSIMGAIRVVSGVAGPKGVSYLRYGNWTGSRTSNFDDEANELQQYMSWFINLPDSDGKTAMDYAILSENLNVQEKIALILTLKSWGGIVSQEYRQTSDLEQQTNPKINGIKVNLDLYAELVQPPAEWQKKLSVSNHAFEKGNIPPLPRSSPMDATKELIEDATKHGLQAAILLSRRVSKRSKVLNLTEPEEKGKQALYFEASSSSLA